MDTTVYKSISFPIGSRDNFNVVFGDGKVVMKTRHAPTAVTMVEFAHDNGYKRYGTGDGWTFVEIPYSALPK
jgi:hypothetical protein